MECFPSCELLVHIYSQLVMAAKHYQELEGVKVQVNDMDGFPPTNCFLFSVCSSSGS